MSERRHNPYEYLTPAAFHITKGTPLRKRSCDDDVAKLSKLAWWILYGGLNINLQPLEMTPIELKNELYAGAIHWANLFNWPTPTNNTGSNFCTKNAGGSSQQIDLTAAGPRTCPITRGKQNLTNSRCWICGHQIQLGNYECEHILNPASQIYFGQYYNAVPKSQDPVMWKRWIETNITGLSNILPLYSFAPSHICCNQVKTQAHLFHIDGSYQQDTLRRFLSEIADRVLEKKMKYNCGLLTGVKNDLNGIRGNKQHKRDTWVENRIRQLEQTVISQRFRDIVLRASRRGLFGLAAAASFDRQNARFNQRGNTAAQRPFVARTTASSNARATSPPRLLIRKVAAVFNNPGLTQRSLSNVADAAQRAPRAPVIPSVKRPIDAITSIGTSTKKRRLGDAGIFRKRKVRQTRSRRGRIRGSRRSLSRSIRT
jgi:hypothetical protein